MAVLFLTFFKDNIVKRWIERSIQQNSTIYQRYEMIMVNYVVINWKAVATKIVDIALKSIDSVKLLYVVVKKLPEEGQHHLME
jgi:hypothetical protein